MTLWDWAVERYAVGETASLCLRLQDEHGLDVDVVLACLWHAQRGGSIDAPLLRAMLEQAAPIDDRVREIRATRLAIRTCRAQDPVWTQTYEHLRAAELAAERIELDRLHALLVEHETTAPGPGAMRTRALRGLSRYADDAASPAVPRSLLEQLVDSALPSDDTRAER